MTQKLFDLANDKCAVETPDNPMLQEVLLGGHLYQIILKVVFLSTNDFVKFSAINI